jgi:hypothetical protein
LSEHRLGQRERVERKSNASARLDGAHTFGDCGFGARKMSEAEATDDRVKATICKWEMFDFGFTKIDAWMYPPGQVDHPWR